MKWIAAFFMVVNVAVYLWLDGHPSLTEQSDTQVSPDVNRQVMVLLDEVDDVSVSAEQATPAEASGIPDTSELSGQENQPEMAVDDAQTELAGLKATDDDPPADPLLMTCFRIGPFRDDQTWQSAVAWMGRSDIDFRHVVSEQRGFQAVRLYLGPFTRDEEVDVAVKDLEGKQIDYYMYRLDNQAVQLSLGYFTQAELAERYLKHLWLKGIQAKSQTETGTLGPYNWMETQTGERDTALLREYDWPGEDVQLASISC